MVVLVSRPAIDLSPSEFLVLCDKIPCRWVNGSSSNENVKEGHFLKQLVTSFIMESTSMTLNDLELPISKVSVLLANFGSDANVKSKLHQHRFSFNLLNLKEYFVRRPQIRVLFQDALLFYCTLYTDCPDGRTDAVARHVNFSQITCLRHIVVLQYTL